MPDTQINIFISYSHSDSAFVDCLEDDLRKEGFGTWVDRRGLEGGQKWHKELQAAVDRSQVLLVVLSPEAVASDYVQIEYGYASDEGKVVIPLYYRACKVPLELRGFQWISFQDSYEQGLAALVKALQLQRERGSATPGASSVDTHASEPGVLLTPPEMASKPEPEAEHPWNVPFRRNFFFTGRSQLLERLHGQLGQAHSAALSQSQALTGLGGIGKTQTAIEYAYRYREEYTAVFWVRAASRETLIADFVALARLLLLPGQDAPDQMQVVAATRRYLEQHVGWLLILDNADELAHLVDFLPAAGQGHVLLTTRAQATGKIAESLSVEKLERSEGLLLLLRRAKLLAPDEPLDNVPRVLRGQAQGLAEELDGLPLALDQAGAYIEETGCSPAEYLALYRQHRLALLKRQSSVSADYPHTVASTWSLSFGQVEQESPAAAELLQLCAFLAPDAIPEAILTEGAAWLGPVLSPVAADPLLLNDAIQTLRRYSLVKRNAEAKLLTLHRLVQVVLMDAMNEATQRLWAERSVRAVNAAFPEVSFATWSHCERCLPHVLACAALIEQYRLTFPEAARLLDQAGCYLRERGLYGQAEPLLHRALTIREQVLGPEHPDTAATLYQLHAILRRMLRMFPEHPDTATTLDHLACLYQAQGKYEQAEPLYQRALAIREHVLGPEHPDTIKVREHYAELLRTMQEHKAATRQQGTLPQEW